MNAYDITIDQNIFRFHFKKVDIDPLEYNSSCGDTNSTIVLKGLTLDAMKNLPIIFSINQNNSLQKGIVYKDLTYINNECSPFYLIIVFYYKGDKIEILK